MTIPTTCPDFVSHPHLVETVHHWKDRNGKVVETRGMRGCYTCQEASASEQQGTTAIALELEALGIPCDVHQTGGFTMCVYIKTGALSYVYANDEGFSFYKDENCEGWAHYEFKENEKAPSQKAKAIQSAMGVSNLHPQKI